MTTPAPFDFYQASLALWSELASRAQNNGQQWLEQTAQVANEDVQHAQARIHELVQQNNWLGLASLPQELALRAGLHQFAAWQQAMQALGQQVPVGEDVGQAALGWQQDALQSLNQSMGLFGNPAAWFQASKVPGS